MSRSQGGWIGMFYSLNLSSGPAADGSVVGDS